MEIKHKECFIPATIREWSLQAVSRYAREAAEFVNLYSESRGINRFLALLETLDWLRKRDEIVSAGIPIPELSTLRRWTETESTLSNPVLVEYCNSHSDAEMHQTLAWSNAVNDAIDAMVHGVPPFPGVRESLEAAAPKADLLVCSATPHDALTREWQEHGISDYVFAIAGQEQGKKAEHIALTSQDKYDPDHVLMIGDAPGDRKAAHANDALFFPIMPGAEIASWKRFQEEGLRKFFDGTFAGVYERALIDEFDTYLPTEPPWQR